MTARDACFSAEPLQELMRVKLRHSSSVVDVVGVELARPWRRMQGFIGPDLADKFAIALGTHPALVWPEWVDKFKVMDEGKQRRTEYHREYRARRAS